MPLIADRYEPTGNASWGGMGHVNECVDRNLARHVMLKMVLKHEHFPRLIDEQKALLKLRSKHVVQLLDVVKFKHNADEITCLVLEKIEGKSLESNFVPGPDFLKVLWQIASGLADIHRAGVIHRDIKPENIILDVNGVVKIIDFGLAREVGKDDKTKSIIGTQPFMAPELFAGSTIALKSPVDVYAFGITALTLLNAQPKANATSPATAVKILQAIPTLGNRLAALIESCIATDPTTRPSMDLIAFALAQEILRDRHRARIIIRGQVHELHAGNRNVTIKSAVGTIGVRYDGTRFVISQLSGAVFINNRPVAVGSEMTSACVITLGNLGEIRAFPTFEVSNPEVMA